MKWTLLAAFAALAPGPRAMAAVADEFMCHVALFDAQGNKVLATRGNIAVVREPVATQANYDMSTAGSAELSAFAPQNELGIGLELTYHHDLKLGADRHVVSAVQTTCLTGSLMQGQMPRPGSGERDIARSDGCDAAGADVTIVEGAPAFDGNVITASSPENGSGHLEVACRHLRSILH